MYEYLCICDFLLNFIAYLTYVTSSETFSHYISFINRVQTGFKAVFWSSGFRQN